VLQTWLLYKNAISSGVAIDDILKYARRTKDDAAPLNAAISTSSKDTSAIQVNMAAIDDIRRQLAKQDATIKELTKELLTARQATATAAAAPPLGSGQAGAGAGGIPRTNSRVTFQDSAQAPKAGVGGGGVRRPLAPASASASQLEKMYMDVPARGKRDRDWDSHRADGGGSGVSAAAAAAAAAAVGRSPLALSPSASPAGEAAMCTPPRVVTPKNRPVTPHASKSVLLSATAPAPNPNDALAPNASSSSLAEGGLSPRSGVVGSSSFPAVASAQARKQRPTDASTEKNTTPGTASTSTSTSTTSDTAAAATAAAAALSEFVFKVPDALPPRVPHQEAGSSPP
jgi:hypothetical protein